MQSMLRSGRKIVRFLSILSVCAFCGLIVSGCTMKRWITRAPSPQGEISGPELGGNGSTPPLTTALAEPSSSTLSLPREDFLVFPKRQDIHLSQPTTEADLQTIVAEFQRVATRDTYRFPTPKDRSGANVYKAALARVQHYEATHPDRNSELLAFIRARAYERLRDYDQALAQYQILRQQENGLAPEATTAVEALSRFQAVKHTQVTADTPVEYLEALDAQIAAWQELQQHYAGTPYQTLAREEEERVDYAKVILLELNRYRVEDGNESVLLAYNQLINKHKESKNLPRYQIKLGDFYFTLAQEYVALYDPQSLRFDASTFEELGRAALRFYAQVVQEEGIVEKQEAKGKLEALEAYMAKIGRLSR
jgi:hypothetical protein